MSPTKRKIRLAIIYGGRSGEHEVSLCSAASVIAALDRAKYQVVPVLIDQRGSWWLDRRFPGKGQGVPVVFSADPSRAGLLDKGTGKLKQRLDAVLPLTHGTFGEDGCLQGMLESAGIPYAGAGVLGSAIGMDKAIQKQLWQTAGLPVVPWLYFSDQHWALNNKAIQERIGGCLGFPVFVKPANLGSSVGISKVTGPDQLKAAIELALQYDTKIVVEQGIVPLREIEFAVIGTTEQPEVSLPGEIVASNDFYDYAAKYVDGVSGLHVPATLPPQLVECLRSLTAAAWQAVDAYGFARIDFLLNANTGHIYLNEINTIPGFTDVSMFPQLCQASGLTYAELLDRLVDLAIARHHRIDRLQRKFKRPAKKGGLRS